MNNTPKNALLLSGIKVVLIDDDLTVIHNAKMFLSEAGCQVVLAEDSLDGLSKIAHHLPDMIFVDATMPHLDGYRIRTLIKKHLPHLNIPVIILVSKGDAIDLAHGKPAGTEQYLAKPFDKESLIGSVIANTRG
jgi:twitching motility two-component system response regulator PilG